MRMSKTLPLAAILATGIAVSAHAQMLVTSITASFPDLAGKVPGFNLVPGAGIANWSIGLAQGVLTSGQQYNYCVSLASGSATASGSAKVSYKITRGSTVIQTATIITAAQFPVGPNGVWYLCSGHQVLPSSPGAALLTASVAYKANGSATSVTSKQSVPGILK